MYPRSAILIVIRAVAVACLCALIFVFCPFGWMAALHEGIGMGTLPYSPLSSYLTRCLSALYAILGALLLAMSFNIRRYRPLLRLIAWIAIIGGIGVTYLGFVLRLPAFWTALEGPLTVLFGVMVLIFLPRAAAR